MTNVSKDTITKDLQLLVSSLVKALKMSVSDIYSYNSVNSTIPIAQELTNQRQDEGRKEGACITQKIG